MSDGMGRELAYLSSHATNRYFIPNWGIYFNSCFFFWCHRFKFSSSDNTILSEVLVLKFCSISFLKSSKTFPL